MPGNYSLYFHIPFCRQRCHYCDFNTYAGLEELIPAYTRALCAEIVQVGRAAGEALPVHTVYFGGGTPSLLPAAALGDILQAVRAAFDCLPELEVTIEANPGTLSLAYLREISRLGVNRLSLGMQSAQAEELRLLGRRHTLDDVQRAVAWARQAGLENLNLDLIYGIPGQDLASWEGSLRAALAWQPQHLSLYALTIETGTPLQRQAAQGLLAEVDDDLAADMYELAQERLAAAGFEQYEISNWARRNAAGRLLAARHNLQYWRSEPYLGFGAGAHGYANGWRTANALSPAVYIQRLQLAGDESHLEFPCSRAVEESRPLSISDEMGELMIMGLRLTEEGVSRQKFRQRFGQELEQAYPGEIARLIGQGLLEWTGPGAEDRLRLTRRGYLLGNVAFREFV